MPRDSSRSSTDEVVKTSRRVPDDSASRLNMKDLNLSTGVQPSDDVVEKKLVKSSEKTKSKRKINETTEHSFVNCKNSRPLPIITLDELAWHDSSNDCWIAIYDYIYDCTEFLRAHPGGQDVIVEYAGRDATIAFIGAGHTSGTRKMLKKYCIGELPIEERLFRKTDGVKIVELS